MEKFYNQFLWLVLCVVLGSGCAVTTVTTPAEQKEAAIASVKVQHIFPAEDVIKKLLLGISREEALALIGRSTTIGYELRQGSADEYQAVTIQNPHKSQQVTKGNHVYQVDYYLVQIKAADNNITDDELIPLVFESNRLVGKGWEFLQSKIKR